MLRGVLGVLSGILLANSTTAYGGAGIGLLMLAADQHAPVDLAILSAALGAFAVVMDILMLGLAFLLFVEFIQKKLHFTKILRVVIVPSLIVLSLIHIAAYLGLERIPNAELGKFIDAFVSYAVQALAASILFVLVHQMGVRRIKGSE